MTTINDLVSEICEVRDISKTELADSICISYTTLQSWCAERSLPSEYQGHMFHHVWGVPLDVVGCSEYSNTWCDKILEYRVVNRMSRRDFIRLVGTSPSVVSSWETGTHGPSYRHKNILKKLGITLDKPKGEKLSWEQI